MDSLLYESRLACRFHNSGHDRNDGDRLLARHQAGPAAGFNYCWCTYRSRSYSAGSRRREGDCRLQAGGEERKKNTIVTATLYPGIMGVFFLFINSFVAFYGSSTATPVTTLLALMLLWFGVSTPLVFVGSYFGFKKDTITVPVRTNQIARHIPDQVWYTHPAFSIALGGILPFGAVCIELFFIMSAMWLHQLYFVFGFLFIVLIILLATCAEITIVMCYFQLCNEDYRWWWRSFLSAGSSGGYLFLYSIWYFLSKLSIQGVVPSVLYFAYMGMVSFTFFMLTGAIGFFACLWFVRKIYGAIKVD